VILCGRSADEFVWDENWLIKCGRCSPCSAALATWAQRRSAHPRSFTDSVEPLSRGVSCQACHGARELGGSTFRQVVRRVSHEPEQASALTNVREGVTRALLCHLLARAAAWQERIRKAQVVCLRSSALAVRILRFRRPIWPAHWNLWGQAGFRRPHCRQPPVRSQAERRSSVGEISTLPRRHQAKLPPRPLPRVLRR